MSNESTSDRPLALSPAPANKAGFAELDAAIRTTLQPTSRKSAPAASVFVDYSAEMPPAFSAIDMALAETDIPPSLLTVPPAPPKP